MGWRPMGQTAEEAGALYEGVPIWMMNALWAWLAGLLSPTDPGAQRRLELVDDFEQRRRSKKPATPAFAQRGVGGLQAVWNGQDDVIPFLDYLLANLNSWELKRRTGTLAELLERNGSAWKIGTREGFPGLERRVPLGVQEAAEHTMTTAGDAGERLSGAWHMAFGVNPDPSRAYGLAIKAVEDAAVPVVSPTNRKATLGTVIGVLRTQGDWTLPFAREDEHVPNKDVLIGMLKSLWAGQVDRHGGSDEPEHREVTQNAAESAVMLAVPLVQWFSSGAAHQAPKAGQAAVTP